VFTGICLLFLDSHDNVIMAPSSDATGQLMCEASVLFFIAILCAPKQGSISVDQYEMASQFSPGMGRVVVDRLVLGIHISALGTMAVY